jgi:Secretion system C-terminal sorting domain
MKKITSIISALLLSFTIAAQTTIKTDSITQLTTCAGDDLILTFKTTGTFALGNKFTAQISNGFGQFNNPADIGNTRLAFFGQGIILAKLPSTLTLGFFYKIRVISSNPADTSVSPSNIIITTIPTLFNQILSTCQNDSTVLSSSLVGSTYLWSTGATTQSIVPTDTGVYTLTSKDLLGCKTTVTDTVRDSVTCISPIFLGIENTSLSNLTTVYPNPSYGSCNINISKTNSKDILISVVDILGKEVFHISDKNSSTEYKKEINLEQLAKGIYSIRITIGSDVITRKLILNNP